MPSYDEKYQIGGTGTAAAPVAVSAAAGMAFAADTAVGASAAAATSAVAAADTKKDAKMTSPSIPATGTIAAIPQSTATSAEGLKLQYGVVITYSDLKKALDHYDSEKGIFKKIGMRSDEKSIVQLRDLFSVMQSERQFDLTKQLNHNQLFELAKIVSDLNCIDDTPNVFVIGQPASAWSVQPLKKLFGLTRHRVWRPEYPPQNHLTQLKPEYFLDFFYGARPIC